jgi:hypothetical protein
VLHNSIFISGTYANPIGYRCAQTTGGVIANNVLDGNIAARDGASGSVSGNYTTATAGLFVNPAAGDLYLKAAAIVLMNKLMNKVAAPPAAAGVDWDGHARPAGSTDIGADEYSSGSTPTAPMRSQPADCAELEPRITQIARRT